MIIKPKNSMVDLYEELRRKTYDPGTIGDFIKQQEKMKENFERQKIAKKKEGKK